MARAANQRKPLQCQLVPANTGHRQGRPVVCFERAMNADAVGEVDAISRARPESEIVPRYGSDNVWQFKALAMLAADVFVCLCVIKRLRPCVQS